MSSQANIARPYAQAAFEYAQQSNTLSEWNNMLINAASIAKDKGMKKIIQDPQFSPEQRASIFVSVLADNLTTAGKNFIELLASNRRLAALPNIAASFKQYHLAEEKVVEVTMTSAFPVNETDQQKFRTVLQNHLNRDVVLQTDVDKELIGGAVICAGDVVIDGSVRGKLKRLLNHLIG